MKRRPTSLTATEVERFWSKVERGPISECWPWIGSISNAGYGRFFAGSRTTGDRGFRSAHRVAYALTHGAIPDGLLVCHRCDNPRCVNPAHLFLGTNADNSADMAAKGRAVHFSGEENPNSKLDWLTVREIRAAHATGTRQVDLARRFAVDPSLISYVVRGRIWKEEPACAA